MSLFSKFFNTTKTKQSSKDKKINEQPVVLSLDDLFVNNFINKGGKFLYCISQEEALQTFKNIVIENQWENVSCYKNELKEPCKLTDTNISESIFEAPFFSRCEHLIADSGNIMICSNQIGEMNLREFNSNFIVIANTSQIVKDMNEGLTSIKSNCKSKIPTNICAIRDYNPKDKQEDLLNYGASNSKNLYLILVEDL